MRRSGRGRQKQRWLIGGLVWGLAFLLTLFVAILPEPSLAAPSGQATTCPAGALCPTATSAASLTPGVSTTPVAVNSDLKLTAEAGIGGYARSGIGYRFISRWKTAGLM